MHELELRKTTTMWISKYLFVNGEAADWIREPKGAIKKANLTFTTKFPWMIFHHCLSPPVQTILSHEIVQF